MAQYIYTMNKVSKIVPPKREILKDISLSFFPGAKIGVLGLNGAGKSTLLRIMAGVDTEFSGEARPQAGIKVGYLPQEPQLDPNKTVRENVEDGVREALDALDRLNQIYAEYAEPDADFDKLAAEQGKMEDIIQAWDAHNLNTQLEKAADALRLPPWDADVSKLSGGEKRRVALCRLLLSKPDMLLLDEPTNHLDVESIEWLEQFLQNAQGLTLLFISHDRSFIDKIATRIVELDRGILRSYDVTKQAGNVNKGYARYQELKEQQLSAEEKANANFDKKLAEEEVWIRQGIKARRTRNEGRVRALKALREERKSRREQIGQVNISMNDGDNSGKLVANVKHLNLGYGDKTLVKDFTTSIMRGDRIGIIGKNGVGKSTLIHAILDIPQPDITKSGSVKLGTNLQIAFLDQLRDQLDLEATVVQNVAEGSDFVEVAGKKKHIIGYLQDFLFAPERARTPVKALSGGERNRVLLAKQLLKPANILVLDEPTNDLDMATLELLEEAVDSFNGTILLISHDRTFMDNVVTSTWVFDEDSDGNGIVKEYVGGYQDYLTQKSREQAIKPKAEKSEKTAAKPKEVINTDAPKTDTVKKKLSYKEQRELDSLPNEIALLEQEQAELQDKLADGSWFVSDMAAATQASERLNEIDDLLLEKMARWSELDD